MPKNKHNPVHPGQVLKLDFLEPMGISNYRLAKDTGISIQHIGRIVNGTRGVTAEIALCLARYFGTSPQVWMNLQTHYELDKAEDEMGEKIAKRIKTRAVDEQAA